MMTDVTVTCKWRYINKNAPKMQPTATCNTDGRAAKTYAVLSCNMLVKLCVSSLSYSNAKTECDCTDSLDTVSH
jgi:hypothetical protein